METMLATNDLRTILDEAEKAVAREDPAAAERLLRDALTLQEAAVGSQQYEIAKTLNNLAIVCEMSGKKAEAEGCYRRAYEIARSNLPPDDPFVTTSRENLEEFCKVQGVEIEWPAESSLMMLEPEPEPEPERAPAPAPPLRPVREPVHPVELPLHATSPSPHAPARSPGVTFQSVAVPPTPTGPSRIIAIGMLAFVAAGGLLFGMRYWRAPSAAAPAVVSTPETTAPVPETAVPAPEATSPAPESASPAPETPGPDPEAAAPVPEPAAPAPDRAAPPPTTPRAPVRSAEPTRSSGEFAPSGTVPTATPSVVSSQLCRILSVADGAWRCEPASSSPLSPGPIYYYTRISSSRDTMVEHRWYRDNLLHQRVPLRVRANQSGFRTYSRTNITPDRTGTWKVELRSQDGQLMGEDTFVVR